MFNIKSSKRELRKQLEADVHSFLNQGKKVIALTSEFKEGRKQYKPCREPSTAYL